MEHADFENYRKESRNKLLKKPFSVQDDYTDQNAVITESILNNSIHFTNSRLQN
jgi:hypothetical protein